MILQSTVERLHKLSKAEMSIEDANAILSQPEAFHIESLRDASQKIIEHNKLIF